MKKITKNFIFSALSMTALLFVGCQEEPELTGQSTIEVAQNVSGTVAYVAPLAATQTVNEGASGKYQYKLNISNAQPVDIYVHVKVKSGTATRGTDFEFDDTLLIKAYATSVTGNISILSDEVYEPTETFVLEIGGDVNISNASVPASTITFNILNFVGSTLNISFAWPGKNDYDIVTWNATKTPLIGWGDHGATTANPETDSSIHLTDPVGTYYVNVMEWDYGVKFDYTFTIAVAGLNPQIITGTFDGTNVSQYTNDKWTKWGGSYDSFRVLKVVNDGTKFVVTKL
jgi:hypothetical protein